MSAYSPVIALRRLPYWYGKTCVVVRRYRGDGVGRYEQVGHTETIGLKPYDDHVQIVGTVYSDLPTNDDLFTYDKEG